MSDSGGSAEPEYQTRSFSGGGACVEVARTSGAVLIRHSRERHRRPLAFTRDEWAAFVAGVKNGEFDPA